MPSDFAYIYDELFAWCEREDFAGYDPFDGLNSRIFQATPLKHFAPARIAWLQIIKRSKRNLRPLLRVEKGVNPKGLALFALAELSRYRATNDEKHAAQAKHLLEKLDSLKIRLGTPNSEPRAAFGYNFDWQSRAFFAPQGTPTIVPTAFVCQALIEGYQAFGDPKYLLTACQICEFIVHDLNRIDAQDDEVCFSYTPLDNSGIFNASLLAGECLANVGELTQNEPYLQLAAKTARYVLRRRAENGSWAYGSKLRHKWVDNFHTAYVLLSLNRLQRRIPGLAAETEPALKVGGKYWLEHFFLADGTPKYFDSEIYPIDIHSAAAAIVALAELKCDDPTMLAFAEKVLGWTCANMRDPAGFFYYQKRRNDTITTPFIRWSEAWMAFAIARFLEQNQRQTGGQTRKESY